MCVACDSFHCEKLLFPSGRIALIITTFLVLVNIANTVFSSSPTADTINPIQVWILACIVFVFITVIEYTYILFMMRVAKKRSLNISNNKKKVNKTSNASKRASATVTPDPQSLRASALQNGYLKASFFSS